jgi:type III restriction enzyme
VEVRASSLEPLYAPWDEPNRHRVRSKTPGGPADVVAGRRPSPIISVQNFRQEVADWRVAEYAGASATTRHLFSHWFKTEHVFNTSSGSFPFSYYYCQRESIETLAYLLELRGLTSLSAILGALGGPDGEHAALGVNPADDRWAKYAFKLATGAGKTKVMSLVVVWSYFHSLFEDSSPLTRNFLMIAPGITVFERLKSDFRPESGGRSIFDSDPLIPEEWRGDWNVSVVLQDEAAPPTSGGVLYLTNIHRLFERKRTTREKANETYSFMGPQVSKATALMPVPDLRDRLASLDRLLILNDEAHHVWDPGSAWTEAIEYLHAAGVSRGSGLVAQLDFSATPKDSRGQLFPHIVCDTPLGEAVDSGIVKTPVIGHGDQLVERAHSDASYKYENHLTLGYRRWMQSHEEWSKSGHQPLMFVMAESTEAADQIAIRLNTDPAFSHLNGKTVNLHTNLKGKLRKVGTGLNAYQEFVENDKAISDEDLAALRKLSRELDSDTSPYRCIVSVLMLREGWDVKNVTTIVPLRALSARSRILPEQTLGRGLRRMTPPGPGQVNEVVTVVEHRAFAELYRGELAQEGVVIEVVDVDRIPRTTVTIYPDAATKDQAVLDIGLPQLTQGYRVETTLKDLDFEDVVAAFGPYQPLPLGEVRDQSISYEGRHLLTNEVVEQMRVKLPLLADGIGAISFYREEIERAVRVQGLHPVLAPLLQRFLEQVLFQEQTELYDKRLLGRLGDADVREHVRAVFVPLVLHHIVHKAERKRERNTINLSGWQPFQATHSETHPTIAANRTIFNLVPCNRQLEVAMAEFLDRCSDVQAFAKNAGPQCLRIDALGADGQRALYTPDFIVKLTMGKHLVVETKGRVDAGVAAKAQAATEWCNAATSNLEPWEYVFIRQDFFERFGGDSAESMVAAARPSLVELLRLGSTPQLTLDLDPTGAGAALPVSRIAPDVLAGLPSRYQTAIEHATALYRFLEKKRGSPFGAVFQPLLGPLDHAAEVLLLTRLGAYVPPTSDEVRSFFYVDPADERSLGATFLSDKASLLRKLLVFRSPVMPTGLLTFCLNYARSGVGREGTVLAAVSAEFKGLATGDLRKRLDESYNFRNTFIAHEKAELTDAARAREALEVWISLLVELHAAVHEFPTA